MRSRYFREKTRLLTWTRPVNCFIFIYKPTYQPYSEARLARETNWSGLSYILPCHQCNLLTLFVNYFNGCGRYNILPYSRKIWRELYLADWSQPARTKILAEFNLADSWVRSSHTQNFPAWDSIVDIEGGGLLHDRVSCVRGSGHNLLEVHLVIIDERL
jgi:hypothetical protein